VLFAAAVAVEVTGPPQSLLFSLRLPVVVLAAGVSWGAARRRGVRVSRMPASMATPCLILSATAGVAALTMKLMLMSPVLVGVVLGTVTTCSTAAVLFLFVGWPGAGAEGRPAAADV
jgi:hypothetical protein